MEQGKPFKVDESRDKNNDYTKIIDFWRYIEIFTPQDFTPPKDIVNCKSCKLDLEKLPWNYLKEKEKDGEKCRRYHTIYLGIFKGQKLIDFLDKKFIDKNNPLPEQRIDSSQKASVSFRVSPEGILDTSSLFISNCAWAIGQLEKDNDLNNHNYEGFESLKADILNCLTDEEKTKPIDKNTLQKLIDCFKEKLGSFDMLECPNNHHVVSIRYENEPTDTDDFLNSFYIEDLERVKNDMSNIKEGGLRRFLGNQLGEEDKVDVRNFNSWEDYYEYLKPEMYPPSCWPAKGHYPLVFSQQIAINNIYKKLLNSSGIYSVNGPPGTGKTTLLRDLIASIVTYRAELLSKYDKPADAFEPVEHECELCGEKMEVRAGKNGKFIGCSGFPKCTNTKNINSPKVVWKLDEDKYSTNFWPYKDALIDHSIVVASNNNGAVENITKELPEVGAIDDSWVGEGSCYKDLDFFRQVSNQIIGQETWALFCAPLGNSENRKKFTQFFVLAKADENKQDDATTNILEEIDKIDIDWGEAKKRYKKAKEQVEKIRKEKCKDFDEYFKCQDQLKTNNEKLNTLKEQKGSLESEVEGLKNKVKELNTEKEEASKALQELEEALKAKNQDYEKQNQLLKKLKEDTNIHNGDIDKHYSRKPGLLDWIVTLGKSHKRWNQTLVELEEDFKKKKERN
jgi:ssDNA-binding Zn-finger/Zn-ribbon topoisomerase 1